MAQTAMSLLLITLLTGGLAQGPAQLPSYELVLCRPNVPKVLMEGRATFTVVYDAAFDAGGHLLQLERRHGPGSVGPIHPCVSQWQLPAGEGERSVTILLQWEHGTGWTRFVVTTTNFNITLTDPSPHDYLEASRGGSPSSKSRDDLQ